MAAWAQEQQHQPTLSGWHCFALSRKAALISSTEALATTPSSSYGSHADSVPLFIWGAGTRTRRKAQIKLAWLDQRRDTRSIATTTAGLTKCWITRDSSVPLRHSVYLCLLSVLLTCSPLLHTASGCSTSRGGSDCAEAAKSGLLIHTELNTLVVHTHTSLR